MEDTDAVVRRIAAEHIDEPIVAAAFFHARWRDELIGGGVFGAVASVFLWLIRRVRSGLPAYAYFVITPSRVVVLEFRFGPPQLQREIECWSRAEVRTSVAKENRFSADVTIGPRTVAVEAVTYNEASAEVVNALISGSPQTS